jgi:hypothetical protein
MNGQHNECEIIPSCNEISSHIGDGEENTGSKKIKKNIRFHLRTIYPNSCSSYFHISHIHIHTDLCHSLNKDRHTVRYDNTCTYKHIVINTDNVQNETRKRKISENICNNEDENEDTEMNGQHNECEIIPSCNEIYNTIFSFPFFNIEILEF